jgi:hypothetical protein
MTDVQIAVAFLACVWLAYYAVKAFYQDVLNDRVGRAGDRVEDVAGPGAEEVGVPLFGSETEER